MEGKGKYKGEAMTFARNETYNLAKLRESLVNDTYKFSGYITFTVKEPKERVIDAPHFVDKIVQLAINQILKKVYNKSFIHDSYACIDDKGTHKCAERIQYFMRKAKWEYGSNAGITKMDVKKFFYSIDREVLKELLKKKIKCKRTLKLTFQIIDSAEAIDPLGLPLGNTLSQICANTYLSEVDHYVKRKLRVKYYVRYMDDSIAILPTIDEAKEVLEKVDNFIKKRLNLSLNTNKSKVFPLSQGVNIVGYKIHPTHKLLRNDCKKKIKRKVKAMPRLIKAGRMQPEKAEQILNSWLGHAGNANSYNFIQSLIKKNDFIKMIGNKKLEVDMAKIEKVSEVVQ